MPSHHEIQSRLKPIDISRDLGVPPSTVSYYIKLVKEGDSHPIAITCWPDWEMAWVVLNNEFARAALFSEEPSPHHPKNDDDERHPLLPPTKPHTDTPTQTPTPNRKP